MTFELACLFAFFGLLLCYAGIACLVNGSVDQERERAIRAADDSLERRRCARCRGVNGADKGD